MTRPGSSNRSSPPVAEARTFKVAGHRSQVELLPAISLDPDLDLNLPDLPPPPSLDVDADPDHWQNELDSWRREQRSRAGLDPNRPLDGLIALDECTTPELLDAVINYCKSCAEQSDEWVPFLDGGFVFIVDGESFARPTCCVDLREGVADWVNLGDSWGPTWAPIQSGHPGVLARVVEGSVQVSQQRDDFPTEISVAVQVTLEQLRSAALAGVMQVERFAERLEQRMVERGIESARQHARTVAGLVSESPSNREE